MPFDVAAFRAQFPALSSGVAYFDGPGGTQTPVSVGEAIASTLTGPLSNLGAGWVVSERNTLDAIAGFRGAYADLLGTTLDGVVFGRSATQITYDFSRHLAKTWRPGDEVVVSRLDHDANVRPWIHAAERAGATVRWLELDPHTSDLRLEDLDDVITERTRLVAVTGASNLLGTRPDVPRIAQRAHDVGALVYVDGVHLAAHATADLAALGADLLVCSPYKFFGPHCAVLAAHPDLLETLTPDKLVPSTDRVPERFEFGTLPFEIMAGATAAVDVLASVAATPAGRRENLAQAHALIDEHETRLRRRVETALAGYGDRLTVHSRAGHRTPTLFLTFRDHHSDDVSQRLAEHDILAPSGTFYAYEPFRALGLDTDAGLRIGIAAYTDDDDIDRLLAGLDRILRGPVDADLSTRRGPASAADPATTLER